MSCTYLHNLDEVKNPDQAAIAHRIMALPAHILSSWPKKPFSEIWPLMMRLEQRFATADLKDLCRHAGLDYDELTAPITEEETLEIRFRFQSATSCSKNLKKNMRWLRQITALTRDQITEFCGCSKNSIISKISFSANTHFTRAEVSALLKALKESNIFTVKLNPEDLLEDPKTFQARIPKNKYAFNYRARTVDALNLKTNMKWLRKLASLKQKQVVKLCGFSSTSLFSNKENLASNKYFTHAEVSALLKALKERRILSTNLNPEDLLEDPEIFQVPKLKKNPTPCTCCQASKKAAHELLAHAS